VRIPSPLVFLVFVIIILNFDPLIKVKTDISSRKGTKRLCLGGVSLSALGIIRIAVCRDRS